MTATATKRRPKAAGIEIPHADLAEALKAVAPAVPGRASRPILANVLIADGVVTATDLELRIDVAIDQVTPAVLLPHGRLTAILGTARGDAVEITPQGASCVVEIGSGRWTLPTEDAAEFPADPGGDERLVLRLPAEQFCSAVKSVVFACAKDSYRYALGGVQIEVDREAGKAFFVATDGHVLPVVTIDYGDNQDPDTQSVLIPKTSINAMATLAPGSADGVELLRRGNEVVFRFAKGSVTTRLVEGKFPRWRDAFPERTVKPSKVNAGALLAATRSAAIVTTEQSKGVTYAFTAKGLHLTARSSESGESSVTCDLVECGTTAVTQLDPAFVAEWLRTIDSEATVEVEVADGTTACVLRHEEASCVIMPLAKD